VKGLIYPTPSWDRVKLPDPFSKMRLKTRIL